ncbi:hypothetical protein [Massilia niabensis]|uniref:Lipoprotein n=1 Tax=Massilia niabensis TaxID=544910 RepID=A0ABW0L953_9BURK
MNNTFFAAATAALLLLTGCASPLQAPVALSKAALQTQGTRIGVAMTAPAKADTNFPGAACLLCLAAASVANSALTTHTQTLPTEDLMRLKADVADALRKKGQTVMVIDQPIDLSALPKLDALPNRSRVDLSSLRAKYGIDKLLVIDITMAGVTRSYAQYFPTSDPQGIVAGTSYLVNLADNTYDWYLPLHQVKSSAGPWDEPPKFPGVSNAYFQAVEGTRDAVLQPLSE